MVTAHGVASAEKRGAVEAPGSQHAYSRCLAHQALSASTAPKPSQGDSQVMSQVNKQGAKDRNRRLHRPTKFMMVMRVLSVVAVGVSIYLGEPSVFFVGIFVFIWTLND